MWYRLESNQRRPDLQSGALPTELRYLLHVKWDSNQRIVESRIKLYYAVYVIGFTHSPASTLVFCSIKLFTYVVGPSGIEPEPLVFQTSALYQFTPKTHFARLPGFEPGALVLETKMLAITP